MYFSILLNDWWIVCLTNRWDKLSILIADEKLLGSKIICQKSIGQTVDSSKILK